MSPCSIIAGFHPDFKESFRVQRRRKRLETGRCGKPLTEEAFAKVVEWFDSQVKLEGVHPFPIL
jgi:hypothetical protein